MAGWMQTIVQMMHNAKLNEIKNLLRVQGSDANKPYITPVRVIVPIYIAVVEPMRINCQKFDSEFSQFSRHVSDHV